MICLHFEKTIKFHQYGYPMKDQVTWHGRGRAGTGQARTGRAGTGRVAQCSVMSKNGMNIEISKSCFEMSCGFIMVKSIQKHFIWFIWSKSKSYTAYQTFPVMIKKRSGCTLPEFFLDVFLNLYFNWPPFLNGLS
jgi:hypothetical protein